MVHALEEAWRVLSPDGLLIDLRPAMVHRRVDVVDAAGHRRLGFMRERFDDDILANRAVAGVVRRGLFRRTQRTRIACTREMDTPDEFRVWLDHYVSLEKLPSHAWLLRKLDHALADAGRGAKIVVSAPLELQVLVKREVR
jgi:hypothetical protein